MGEQCTEDCVKRYAEDKKIVMPVEIVAPSLQAGEDVMINIDIGEDKRPKTCPDTKCRILWNNYIEKHVEWGGSFDCFGKLHTTDILHYKMVEHVNNYSHCVCAPNGQHIKRHTRYMINEGDAMMILLGFVAILDDADPKYIHKFLQEIINGDVIFRIGEL